MTNAFPILTALLSPNSAHDFLRLHWPDKAYVAHGSPHRLPAALRVPQLQSIGALAATYRGRLTFGNAATSTRTLGMEKANPALLLRMGLSLYMVDIVAMVPALEELLRQLEKELGAPARTARIGAFAAPPNNGVTCHFDAEEVFSIQLQGEKRFHIAKAPDIEQPWGMQFNPGDPCFDDLYPQVPAGFPDPAKGKFETLHMKPGTVLFMPRGTWHYTESGEDSLSVSIVVRTPAAFECALEVLRLQMLGDVRWRRPLYGAWGSGPDQERAREQWQALMQDWPGITAGLTFEDAQLTRLSETELLNRMDATSRFQRRSEARMIFEPRAKGESAVRIVVRDEDGLEQTPLQLEVPAPLVATFRWLAEHDGAFEMAKLAGRFPELTLERVLTIVNALTRGRYLKQLRS
ncbi:MAG: JmjC domain-containing protein [Thiobacillaceae bacterium]